MSFLSFLSTKSVFVTESGIGGEISRSLSSSVVRLVAERGKDLSIGPFRVPNKCIVVGFVSKTLSSHKCK